MFLGSQWGKHGSLPPNLSFTGVPIISPVGIEEVQITTLFYRTKSKKDFEFFILLLGGILQELINIVWGHSSVENEVAPRLV